MPGLYDDSGIIVDPVTGAVISAPATNTAGPGGIGSTIGTALAATRNAMLPPGPTPTAPPPQTPPQGVPGAPPDAAAQLAAVGLPPTGQPAPGAVQASQEGLPPGSAQAADGSMPVPPIPPQAPPPMTPPQAQPPVDPTAQAAPSNGPSQAPDGVSNNYRNNPLNLRFAGQDGATNVNGFAAFSTPEAGINAAKNQFAINASRGINTLAGLVSSWAPPNENDTGAYIANVSKATGIAPDAKIDITDPAIQAKLIPAMSLMENGPAGNGSKAMAQGPGTPAPQMANQMTLANQSTPTSPPAMPGMGMGGADANDGRPFPNVGQPNRQQQLLALAAGMMQGKSFGQGVGKGLENLVGVNQNNQTAQMQANQQYQEQQRLHQQQLYQNGMLNNANQKTQFQGNSPAGPPVMGVGADGKPTAVIRLKDGSTIPLPGVTPAMINAGNSTARLGIAQQAVNARTDPGTIARLTQEKVASTSAQKDQDNYYSSQNADHQSMAEIDEAQQLISQHPELMGSTLSSRWNQFAAQTGLTGEAADLDALQKMTTDQRNKALSALTNGHVGGIRSNAELTNISKAFADVKVQPAAANYILNMQKSQLQANDAWRTEMTGRLQDDPDSVTGRQYNVTKNQFFTDYGKAHPLPDYQSPNGSAPAASPSAASGSPSGAPPGVSKVLRYDAKGNLVQ